MDQQRFDFSVHGDRLAIARLAPDAAVPEWARGGFTSVTRTAGELSIVCPEANVPAGVTCEKGKLALFIEGSVPMTSVGILAALSRALADAAVPIFVISTYDTDWILFGAERFDAVRAALEGLGHRVRGALPRS